MLGLDGVADPMAPHSIVRHLVEIHSHVRLNRMNLHSAFRRPLSRPTLQKPRATLAHQPSEGGHA